VLGLLFLVPIIAIGVYILSSIKILGEYERGVIFRLGRRLDQTKGPGVILVFSPIDRMVRIDIRQQALEVPLQDTHWSQSTLTGPPKKRSGPIEPGS
jgi:regulator of protease activity HflC (stomatin/prohibitin superfamily)